MLRKECFGEYLSDELILFLCSKPLSKRDSSGVQLIYRRSEIEDDSDAGIRKIF